MAATEEPWTVARLLEWTTSHFATKCPDSPRLDAEILLARAMGCKRIDLYVRHGEIPAEPARERFRDLVKRRSKGEPVAYLVGHKEFFSIDFEVNASVLIPRPDTETLVDQALRFLKIRGATPVKVLDLGTGSGCLAITLAKLLPQSRVTAIDLSAAALVVAKSNAKKHGLEERITWLEGDLFSPLKAGDRFDLIVSNPPYIPTGEIAKLDVGVKNHEPMTALDGGKDGLDFYRRIWPGALAHLLPDAKVMVEVGFDQAAQVEDLARKAGFSQVKSVADMGRIPRVVMGSTGSS